MVLDELLIKAILAKLDAAVSRTASFRGPSGSWPPGGSLAVQDAPRDGDSIHPGLRNQDEADAPGNSGPEDTAEISDDAQSTLAADAGAAQASDDVPSSGSASPASPADPGSPDEPPQPDYTDPEQLFIFTPQILFDFNLAFMETMKNIILAASSAPPPFLTVRPPEPQREPVDPVDA